ncbi:unnamed protein product [Mytilus coruscus]|uniref:DDE Tnp4 domain-containing protein n=1 Tax=Mytilus coruscus TaxID=42192 RepID=A0A6J8D6A7_MYTCO|nr:unnamed protein product [Mytilus coruscus]
MQNCINKVLVFKKTFLVQGSTLGDTISSRDVSSSLTGGYLFVSKVRIVAYLIGIKQTSPTEKGYTPTLFPYQKKTPARKTSNSTKQEIQVIDANTHTSCPTGQLENKTSQRKKRLFQDITVANNQVGRPLDKKPFEPIIPQINNHDYINTETEKGNYWLIKEYLPEIKEKMNELDRLKKINESQAKQILSLENIKENPKRMLFWTGFSDYENFYALFQYFEPRATNMRYWKGDAGMPDTFSDRKKGPERKLSLIDEFFLTMVRLKVGLLVEDLAIRFSISVGLVSQIFSSWINLMYVDLKELCELPSKEVLNENQSHAMKDFEDVRVIIDCTEIFVQNPSKLDARKQVFSNYKHHNTFKFLIGVSPQMAITYVSRMYGGRASDKFITCDSVDLLHNLEVNKGSVMADRGFLISGILNDMGVKLHMPSFKGTERAQLKSSEAKTSEDISKVRIHVERAIQRVKTFHILDGEVKLSMKDLAEQIFTVCAYLVNFQTPILKK